MNTHARGGVAEAPATDDSGQPRQTGGVLVPVLLLYAAVISAQFISLAFGRTSEGHGLASMALPSLLFLSVLTLPACWAGVVLGRKVGMGVSGREVPSSGQPRNAWHDVAAAVAMGLLMGSVLLVLRLSCQPFLPPELPELGFRGALGGLAVSLGAAVGEEVWFRLGLMTVLTWIATRVRGERLPSRATAWTIIVLTSLGFGAAHLPQLASFGAAAPVAVGATIAGNVAVGVLYGWCYWRMGLVAAMASHFAVDLVLHVLTAVLP